MTYTQSTASTPEEIAFMQWQDWEIEASNLAKMLWQRNALGGPIGTALKDLWDTHGGTSAAYLTHQDALNTLIGQAYEIPAPWNLESLTDTPPVSEDDYYN